VLTVLGSLRSAVRSGWPLLRPAWLRRPLVFYIDSMRAAVLVVLVWTYFAFPILTGWSLPRFGRR